MQNLAPEARVARVRDRIAHIDDWLQEIGQEAAGRPLSETTDLATLHRQLVATRRRLEAKLAEMEGIAPDDTLDPFADLLSQYPPGTRVVDGKQLRAFLESESAGDDFAPPSPWETFDPLAGKTTPEIARRLINDACAKVGRIAPDFVAVADDRRRVMLTWLTPSEVMLVYSDLRTACEAIELG